MKSHGAHPHQFVVPYRVQHEGAVATPGRRFETAPVPLNGRHHPRTWRYSVTHQRPGRSHSYSHLVACKDRALRTCRQSEGQFQRLGSPRVPRQVVVRRANGLCGVHGQPLTKVIRLGLHLEPGRTPSQGFFQGGACCFPQEARNRIQREIFVGMNIGLHQSFLSPLKGLGLLCRVAPRLTPWATVSRCSAAIA